MSLDKDARHDFYSIAAGDVDTEEGLRRSELWAEAVFFLPAGETMYSFASLLPRAIYLLYKLPRPASLFNAKQVKPPKC